MSGSRGLIYSELECGNSEVVQLDLLVSPSSPLLDPSLTRNCKLSLDTFLHAVLDKIPYLSHSLTGL